MKGRGHVDPVDGVRRTASPFDEDTPSGAETLALRVAASKRLQLNGALHECCVRLDPGCDYARSSRISMKSDQALYGLTPGARYERGPEAENVIVSDVQTGKLSFPPSNFATSKNCFASYSRRSRK